MRTIVMLAALLTLPGDAVAQTFRRAPVDAPARASLTTADEPGTRLSVTGRVIGSDNRAIAGASIHVYQTDANGEYVPGARGGSDRPRLFALLRSDTAGTFGFSTIRPGSYPGTRNPGHIHFEVEADGYEARIYEIVFEGDPLIPDAFRAQASRPFGGVEIVTARTVSDGALAVEHDIRLRAR